MLPRFSPAIAWAAYEYTRDPQVRNAAAAAIQHFGWNVTASYVGPALIHAGQHTTNSIAPLLRAVFDPIKEN
jgi:sirohydrochlorin ferrochelatase